MVAITPSVGFDIRQQLDFPPKGRAACPACTQDDKTPQKKVHTGLDGYPAPLTLQPASVEMERLCKASEPAPALSFGRV
jgi:hypothetical protein